MIIYKQKKRFSKKILSVFFVSLVIAGGLGALWYQHYSLNNAPTHISTETVGVPLDGATLLIDGKPFAGQLPRVITAQPNETVVFTAPSIAANNKPNAAALTWHQSTEDPIDLEIRTKTASEWSEWRPVEPDIREASSKAGTTASALVITESIDDIQYRIKLVGSTSHPSPSVDVSKSSYDLIDSRDGPSAQLSLLESIGRIVAPSASATPGIPRVISRAEWGSPEPTWSTWPPEYTKLGRVIVHHTATGESSDSYADVRAIWQYHAVTLGWGDIGYHYLFDSAGRTFQGRYYDQEYAKKRRVEVVGGHAYDNNYGTLGVSMIGDYRYKTVSDGTLDSLSRLVGYKLAPYRIDPAGTGPYGETIVGHYQVGQTSCPGINAINKMGDIKARAQLYYTVFKPLFDFQSLETPRWLEIVRNTYKYNTDTLQRTDGPFLESQHIKFTDKFEKDGIWYLRSAYDAERDIRQGIPQRDVKDISVLPIVEPVWLDLKEARQKVNPVTDTYHVSGTWFEKGKTLRYTSKITVNGKEYLRSEYDTNNSQAWFIAADSLVPAVFKPFAEPRYMRVAQSSPVVEPFSARVLESSMNAKDVKFSSKITTDQTYFRTEEDTLSGNQNSVPAAYVEEIPFESLVENSGTIALKLTQSSYKFRPSQLLATDILIPEGSIVSFRNKITVNGLTYYQTTHDARYNHRLGIPASSLTLASESYMPFEEPRHLTPTTAIPKTDLLTMRPLDQPLSTTTPLRYTTKVYLNGEWYARTEFDSTHKLHRGVPLKLLQDSL